MSIPATALNRTTADEMMRLLDENSQIPVTINGRVMAYVMKNWLGDAEPMGFCEFRYIRKRDLLKKRKNAFCIYNGQGCQSIDKMKPIFYFVKKSAIVE